MIKRIFILISVIVLTGISAYADDVSIDSDGNVTTGVANPNANLEVTGASGEDAILGSASGTGGAGVYGENIMSGDYGILGYTDGVDYYGVYGHSPGGYAGYFLGNARITGNLMLDGSLIGPALGVITGVTAGTGLTGGGTSGDVTLNADTTVLQSRVNGSCPAGQSIRLISPTGTVTCEVDNDSGGDITGVNPGFGLAGGGTAGTVTLNADTTVLQSRVNGSCPAGQSIRVISSTGTVTCEVDDTGTDTDWTISGTNMYSGVSGNVGIGTNNPSNKLDVRGSTIDYLGYFYNDNNAGGNAAGIFAKGDALDGGNGVGVGGYFEGVGGNPSGEGYGTLNIAYSFGTYNAYGVYSDATRGSTTGRQYAFYGIGDGYFSGDVGIGTGSPAYSLDVAGHARVQGPDGFNSAGETAITYYGDANHFIKGTFAGGINVNSFDGATDPITFSFSGSEKMRVTNTGNVGIGTTGPTRKLEVWGSTNGYVAYFENDNNLSGNNGYGLYVKGDANDTGSGNGFGGTFVAEGGSTSGESVGIQSYASSYGSSNAYGVLSVATSGSTSGRQYAFYGYGDGYFSGDVGIGTDSPAYSLDVAGHTRVQGPDGFDSAGETAIIYYGDGNHYIQGIYAGGINVNSHSGANDPITFSFSGSEKMRITYTGSVGIGTNSPAYTLQVGNAGDGTQARANAWNTLSDRSLKKNLVKIYDAVDKVNQMNGYYFNWENGTDTSRQVGVVAQEVEKVLPEIVSSDDTGLKSLDYGKLVPLLVEAIKEQQRTIAELTEEMKEIKRELKLMGSLAMADQS